MMAEFYFESQDIPSPIKNNFIISKVCNIQVQKQSYRVILEKKKYVCEICLGRFSSKRVLKTHVQRQNHTIINSVPAYLINVLPRDYRVNVLYSEKINEEAFKAKIVLPSVSDISSMRAWVKEFCNQNHCSFSKRMVGRFDKTNRMIIREHYLCYFYGPERGTGRKKKLKGTNCCSRIMSVLRIGEPNFAVITLFIHHNHPLYENTASSNLKEVFSNMFESGATPSEALKNYLLHIQTQVDNGLQIRGNENKIKDYDRIRHIFHKMANEYSLIRPNLSDSVKDLIFSINSKFSASVCLFAEISENFVMLIVTPLMRRVSETQFADELMFTDSVGTVGIFGLKVFLLMTEICGISVPLGVMIVSNETEEILSLGFTLFNEITGKSRRFRVIVTDDHVDLKKALNSHYPHSTYFLCPVRFLRTCQKWLLKNENILSTNQRSILYDKIQNMVYAEDVTTFDANNVYLKNCTFPKKIYKYLQFLDSTKEQWANYCKRNHLSRQTNVNIILEHNYRISKEQILTQIKSMSLENLINFFVYQFFDNLKHIGTDRWLNDSFKENCKVKIQNYDIYEGADDTFKLYNKKKNLYYEVNTNMGICTCFSGSTGGYCKHQKLIMVITDGLVYPKLKSDVLNLFYFIISDNEFVPSSISDSEAIDLKPVEELVEIVEVYEEDYETEMNDSVCLHNEMKTFENNVADICEKMKSYPKYFLKALQHLNVQLESVKKNPSRILNAIYSFNAELDEKESDATS